MNLNSSERKRLDQSSNVLLLAPLTPTGNSACLELLGTTTPPGNANVLAVTYTPPPETWVDDWRSHFQRLPTELAFIHANTVGTPAEADETRIPLDVSVSRVDPTQPMDVVAPLSEQLTRWQANDNESLVAVQTLTVLLEYVDFDAAFRYLHVLTHRLQASDALGVYHMDPTVHDAETIEALKSLFDAVVSVSGGEWSVTDAERRPTSDGESGFVTSIRTALSEIVPGVRGGDSVADPDGTSVPQDVLANLDDPSPADARADLSDATMLTDEDRIRELLTQYGGRMKQADVTEATDWSKSTVSRKLSKMEDEGLVTRVQVGRGNLVFLNGYEPETARSTQENE